jgi:hypothetical protein
LVASQHYFAGSALVEISGADREAAEELEQAVRLAGPGPGAQYWFGAKALASVDVAAMRLRSADSTLRSPRSDPHCYCHPLLPSARRMGSLTGRIRVVRAELAAPVFRGSARVRELDERIEEFGRNSVTAGLHSLPAGPG